MRICYSLQRIAEILGNCFQAGQQITGYIDHLVETAEGPLILDHNIFPGKREVWEKKVLVG